MASAMLATTSGVRLVGPPSPSLPRLLMLCAGSLFHADSSCHFSFFVRLAMFQIDVRNATWGLYKLRRAFDSIARWEGKGRRLAVRRDQLAFYLEVLCLWITTISEALKCRAQVLFCGIGQCRRPSRAA